MFIGSKRVFEEVLTETTVSANTRKVGMIGVTSLNDITDKVFYIKSNATSTGEVTLQINNLVAKDLTKYQADGTGALHAGAIQEGQILIVTYNGEDFVLLNPVPGTV